MQQVVQHLSNLGERLNAIDADDLRDTFLIKNRGDGRVETCLKLLNTDGCTTGELGRDLTWVRTPSPAEIWEWLPEDKRKRDLMGLLEMVKYAREEGCRKGRIEKYFGFEFAADNCGACDICLDREAWLAQHLPDDHRRRIRQAEPAATSSASSNKVARGDWIHVRGHGLCAVKRVHKTPKGITVDVERAKDLETRSFDLRRVRWRKVDD